MNITISRTAVTAQIDDPLNPVVFGTATGITVNCNGNDPVGVITITTKSGAKIEQSTELPYTAHPIVLEEIDEISITFDDTGIDD